MTNKKPYELGPKGILTYLAVGLGFHIGINSMRNNQVNEFPEVYNPVIAKQIASQRNLVGQKTETGLVGIVEDDEVLLAKMLFGEARNCSENEKIAIAYTAINRVNDNKKWNGETLREVILKPWQYSCFNENDVNKKKLMNPNDYNSKAFEECLDISRKVLSGKYEELNNGQTHYFNPKVVYPSWAGKLKRIGKINNSKHDFYIED